jgi:aspartyl-tRNA synthetase
MTRNFVNEFMASPEAIPFHSNPDGQPGIFIYDPRQPLGGLQPFGFQTAEYVEEVLGLEEGDLVVLQARKKGPFTGGFTPMGRLRLALHKAAVAKGYTPPPTGFAFLWITDFPLFTPTDPGDSPGQGGNAGLSSTHHPFTSPLSPSDIDLLPTNPSAVLADHYDIVCNGVELGGGSRRIHDARVQEYILRDVLQMSEERVDDFRHLLDVLKAGCPPHAGIALGFDRLIAVMLGRESVRDVIAFPKSGKGEDVLVKSPTRVSQEQLATYHLKLVD